MKKIISYCIAILLAVTGCSSQSGSVIEADPIQHSDTEISSESVYSFLNKTSDKLLSGDENEVISPVNLYIALCMLSECCDGDAKEELLELVNESECKDLMEATYKDEDDSQILLGNSLWLNNKLNYNDKTLKTISSDYYASIYTGTMGSDDLNSKLQAWMNEQTKDLLGNQIKDVKTTSDTVAELVSTLYFKADWSSTFDSADNEEDIFYTDTEDITVEYMKEDDSYASYFDEDSYSMIEKSFTGGEHMWFILPDENSSVQEILQSKDYLKVIEEDAYPDMENIILNIKIPKFDITSKKDCIDSLKQCGINQIFGNGDFSPLTSDTDMAIDKIDHVARVMIDEDGCIGAAYTDMGLAMMSMIPENVKEINFVCNRPFIFVVTSDQNVPIFTGVIQNPGEE